MKASENPRMPTKASSAKTLISIPPINRPKKKLDARRTEEYNNVRILLLIIYHYRAERKNRACENQTLSQFAREWLTQLVLRSSYIRSCRLFVTSWLSFPYDTPFAKTSTEILRHTVNNHRARNHVQDIYTQNLECRRLERETSILSAWFRSFKYWAKIHE